MKLEIEIYLCPDCFVPINLETENFYGSKKIAGKCPKCKKIWNSFECGKVVQNVE